MAVEVTFSATDGGSAFSGNLDHGSGSAGTILSEQTIYIRHDGVNSITNCAVYIAPKSDTYSGDTTAQDDFDELLAWGDASVANDFGGIQVNMDADGGFPAGSWGTVGDKDPTSGFTFRTGQGDSVDNAITLLSVMGLPGDGVIPPGDTPDIKMKIRVKVPSSEGSVGNRQFDVKLKYTYTS